MAHDYDLVIVGSGLAGASLAKVIAEAGRRVLVLERETRFRDRVRGEGMHPWGVAELRALGLYDLLTQRCAREVRWWVDSQVGAPERRNDLIESGPHHAGELTFYHPEMQETLSHAAEESGAEVRRGAMVKAVSPGDPPTVTWQQGDSTQTVRARLVVGADGRESRLRGWGGFDVVRDPERLRVSGVLLSGLGASEDAIQVFSSPGRGPATLIFPLGGQRFRTY